MKLLIPLFLLLNLTLTAQQFFYSNSLSMELQKLPEIESVAFEDVEWILKKTGDGNNGETVLYQFGIVKKRVTISDFLDSVFIDGKLNEEIRYGQNRQISEIVHYNESGIFSEKELYKYNSDGEIWMIIRSDEKGVILSELEYSTREDGSLRMISLFDEDKLSQREMWNSFGGSLFMEERSDLSDREVTYYNDQNNIEQINLYSGDQQTAEKNFTYYADGQIKQIENSFLEIDEVLIESMNVSGQIIREESFKGESLLYNISYQYSGNKLIQKEKFDTGFIEKWMYFYKNDELVGEDYYRNGILKKKKKITDFQSNSYTIELYDSGRHILNLFYVGEHKKREEYISGGKIVRTRELGD